MLAHPFSLTLPSSQVVKESTCWTPLIFILSPGVDPTAALLQQAETSGMSKHFHALSLGQGMALIAKSMLEEAVKDGTPSLLCLSSCPFLTDSFCCLAAPFFFLLVQRITYA